MRILVTGAFGFTGRHFIAQAQKQGHECVALSNKEHLEFVGIKTIVSDLTDKEALVTRLKTEQFDAVVHLAAISFVAHGNINEIYDTNLIGTINLVDVVNQLSSKPVHFVIASSGNIYGNAKQLPIVEESEFNPANDYAASKCAMEMALKVRSHNTMITVVRPFNYTGAGQAEHFLIPKIVAAFNRGDTSIELGNLDVSRDFTDVRDLVTAYLALLETRQEGIFNVCSGEATSLTDIVKMCEKLSGRSIEVTVNPAFVRSNEVKVLYGDDRKLRRAIGDYRKYCIEETLAWMLLEQ